MASPAAEQLRQPAGAGMDRFLSFRRFHTASVRNRHWSVQLKCPLSADTVAKVASERPDKRTFESTLQPSV
jgi:hypothetical protein